MVLRTLADWEPEESLENSLNWVPKVQGESRISQANGQSTKRRTFRVEYE